MHRHRAGSRLGAGAVPRFCFHPSILDHSILVHSILVRPVVRRLVFDRSNSDRSNSDRSIGGLIRGMAALACPD